MKASAVSKKSSRPIDGRGVALTPIDLLLARTQKRDTRPLLRDGDPRVTLERLLGEREPIYALADLTVQSRDAPHETIVTEIVVALQDYLKLHPARQDGSIQEQRNAYQQDPARSVREAVAEAKVLQRQIVFLQPGLAE